MFSIEETKKEIIVKVSLEKNKGKKLIKVTSQDVKRFLNEKEISYGKILHSSVVVSDDETRLNGTWVFELPTELSKLSTKHELFDPTVSEPPQTHILTDELKTFQQDAKKRGPKRKQTLSPSVLVPSEE